MAEEEYQRVIVLVPEPFYSAWQRLISLCYDFTKTESQIPNHKHWPIHALGIKAARTTLSIATLAAMRQWTDAWILGRALFETEIIVKWLLESDTGERIDDYLNEIADEEKRVLRRMKEGISVTAQVSRDLFSDRQFSSYRDPNESNKSKRRLSVRERARRVALERSYDIGYWMASVYSHSHALSLSQWNPDLKAADSPFPFMLGSDDKQFTSWLVLEALPMHALDTIQLVDYHFTLHLDADIQAAREAFRDVTRKVSKGTVDFTSDIERGTVRLKKADGTTVTYTPKKSGIDPLDKLL